MKYSIYVLATLLLIIRAPALAADTDTLAFKELKMGSSIQDLKSIYPAAECGKDLDSENIITCRILDSFGGFVGDKLNTQLTIAGISATGSFKYYNEKLEEIILFFKNPDSNFETVVIAIKEKYGTPFDVEQEEVTTRIGVKYINQTIGWVFTSGSIVARKYTSNINTSTVYFSSSKAPELRKLEKEKRTKKAAEDL